VILDDTSPVVEEEADLLDQFRQSDRESRFAHRVAPRESDNKKIPPSKGKRENPPTAI
jgi:hypothetical protein